MTENTDQAPNAENDAPRYRCAECDAGISTADDLVTVNMDGRAKSAHRTCPIPPGKQAQVEDGRAHSDIVLIDYLTLMDDA